jgi:fido (protein-threonine AMPylation protein)
MVVLEENEPELFERIQEQNLLRQYDLLANCIEIGLRQGPAALDKYTIWALNHVAVANISQFGGRFREEPIYLEHHIPPHFREVPDLMDRFLSTIHENWFLWTATELAAYGLWRLNWIHPFIEGNGRAAILQSIEELRHCVGGWKARSFCNGRLPGGPAASSA